jgi:4-diphosphocytidyl-2-C-methyl-D-erythritol kinase
MITFPNAKINIGLNIVEKRPDGYHNLETVFYPVPLKDALEIVPSDGKKHSFHSSGIPIEGDPDKNLVMKALHLLEKDFHIPGLNIYLEKAIPFGAGLGGGSADAAFMLKMLNEFSSLNLPDSRLEDYASQIGADCPFFIKDKPAFASGTGNILEPVALSLNGYFLVLIKPDIHISTPEAYSLISPQKPEFSIKEWINKPVNEWKNGIVNDFEKSIFVKYPAIAVIKEQLYSKGALYASMSGSGSSVFGIFDKKIDFTGDFKGYYVFQSELS